MIRRDCRGMFHQAVRRWDSCFYIAETTAFDPCSHSPAVEQMGSWRCPAAGGSYFAVCPWLTNPHPARQPNALCSKSALTYKNSFLGVFGKDGFIVGALNTRQQSNPPRWLNAAVLLRKIGGFEGGTLFAKRVPPCILSPKTAPQKPIKQHLSFFSQFRRFGLDKWVFW